MKGLRLDSEEKLSVWTIGSKKENIEIKEGALFSFTDIVTMKKQFGNALLYCGYWYLTDKKTNKSWLLNSQLLDLKQEEL